MEPSVRPQAPLASAAAHIPALPHIIVTPAQFAFFSHIRPVWQSVTVPSPLSSYRHAAVICIKLSGKLIVPVPDRFRSPFISTPGAAYAGTTTSNIKRHENKNDLFPDMDPSSCTGDLAVQMANSASSIVIPGEAGCQRLLLLIRRAISLRMTAHQHGQDLLHLLCNEADLASVLETGAHSQRKKTISARTAVFQTGAVTIGYEPFIKKGFFGVITISDKQSYWWRRGESNPGPKALLPCFYMCRLSTSVSDSGPPPARHPGIPSPLVSSQGRERTL